MIWDAEAKCAATIREAETTCMDHTHALQWSLDESMQDFKCEAIEKVCRAALQDCSTEVQGVLMYPLQLLMGNMSLATLLATTAQLAIPIGRPTPQLPLQLWQRHPHLQQGPNNNAFHPTRGSISKFRGGWSHSIRCDPGGVAPPKAEGWGSLGRLLKDGCWEAFSKDAEIIKAARHAYHPSHKGMFTQEGSYDLMMTLGDQSPEHRDPQGAGGLSQWVGTESHQLHCKSFPMGDTIFPHSIANWVTQHHGVEGNSLPWGPTLVRQSLILPLVW